MSFKIKTMKKLFTILFIIIITGLFEKEIFAQNGITYNGTSVAELDLIIIQQEISQPFLWELCHIH